MSHGTRYSKEERMNILQYRQSHTYQETAKEFGVSQMTIARWEKRYMRNITNTKAVEIDSFLTREEFTALLQVVKFLEGVKMVALISAEGQVLSSVGDAGISEEMVAAQTIRLLSTTEQLAQGVGFQSTELALVKTQTGMFLVLGAGPLAVMVIIFDATVDLTRIVSQDLAMIDRVRGEISSRYSLDASS